VYQFLRMDIIQPGVNRVLYNFDCKHLLVSLRIVQVRCTCRRQADNHLNLF
jgi:hypothetical protein